MSIELAIDDEAMDTGPACSLMYDLDTGRMNEITLEEL